jgi:hypothetical protein
MIITEKSLTSVGPTKVADGIYSTSGHRYNPTDFI